MTQDHDPSILTRPVLIVGSPRSGTSFLGNMMSTNPTVSYLGEPRLIWKHGNEARSDMLRADHATPEVVSQVRSQLAQLASIRGGQRLVDKTPQNALRLEFVDRVLPDCRVYHLIRDGRSAVLSIRDNWLQFGGTRSPSAAMRRLREIDWRRAPYYLREALQRFLPRSISRVAGRPVWGPHLPGIQGLLAELELIEVCCLQWRWSVETACHYGRTAMPPDRYREQRLENLGRESIEAFIEFAEIGDRPEMWDYFEEKYRPAKTVGHEAVVTDREEELMQRWLTPTMEWLGER